MLKKKKSKKKMNLSLQISLWDLKFLRLMSGDCLENYKDADVVSVLPERMTSATADPLNSRIETQEDGYLDYKSRIDKISTLPFEFQKTEWDTSHRKLMAPFSKQAPSKWDDAQKWIASPTSNRVKTEPSVKKNSHGNRQPVSKVVVEVADLRLVPYEEPDTEGDYVSSTMIDSYSKSVLMIEDSVGDSAKKENVAAAGTTGLNPDGSVKLIKEGGRGGQKKSRLAAAAAATGATAAANPPIMDLDLPVDPNEPTYCLCNQVSYGEMVACDNPDCKIEWFHYGCVGLKEQPKGKWYCGDCNGMQKRRKGK